MTRGKKVLIGVAVAVAALIIVALLTTPSFSGSDDLTQWSTELEATSPEVVEPQPMLATTPANERLTRWRTTVYVTRRQQLDGVARASVTTYQRRARVCTVGGNLLVRRIIAGCLSMGWRFNRGWNIVAGSLSVNTWGETNALTLWEWVQDDTHLVRGAGTNTYGVEYRYRRAHFHFRRGIGDFAQHVYPWAALTVRGNGTCSADKYAHSGTLSC